MEKTFNKKDSDAIQKSMTEVTDELKNFKKVCFHVGYIKKNKNVEVIIKLPDVINNMPGIYIIETSDKGLVDLVNNKWNDFKECRKTVPQINDKNQSSNCLYVGKIESNLKIRLEQHLYSVNSTYALNLQDFLKCYQDSHKYNITVTCYYYTCALHKSSRGIKMLIRAIEGYYHEELAPLLGSSK